MQLIWESYSPQPALSASMGCASAIEASFIAFGLHHWSILEGELLTQSLAGDNCAIVTTAIMSNTLCVPT